MAHFADSLLNLKTSNSFSVKESSFALTFRDNQHVDIFSDDAKGVPFFDWIASPGNEELIHHFANGMVALENLNGRGGLHDFDWERFDRPNGLIVDVSGR
jgi:hypothetical protein